MAIRVEVQCFGTIRQAAGTTLICLMLDDDASVADLLRNLGARLGPEFADQVLTSGGNVQSYVQVTLNDEVIKHGRWNTLLRSNGRSPHEVSVYVFTAHMGG